MKKANKFFSILLSCSLCEKMVESREQVNIFNPLLPYGDFDKEYMFVGIAPGRIGASSGENSKEIRAFEKGSGLVLKKVLKKLKILDKAYVTNVIKCITPKDDIFRRTDVELCVKLFLKTEIERLKPKTIFVMGKRAQRYWDEFVNEPCIKIWHPSFITHHRRSSNVFKQFVEQIRDGLCLQV